MAATDVGIRPKNIPETLNKMERPSKTSPCEYTTGRNMSSIPTPPITTPMRIGYRRSSLSCLEGTTAKITATESNSEIL